MSPDRSAHRASLQSASLQLRPAAAGAAPAALPAAAPEAARPVAETAAAPAAAARAQSMGRAPRTGSPGNGHA
ncbi:MAG: hypothetical protein DMG01_07590 [Acidobacteria bacterium]|nr:MAG: hypothetical protein DMG01_07590 [Acidobacteriota bacterium]